MQRKPPYCVATEQTEDGSSQQNIQTNSINTLQHVNIIDVWADNFHEEIQKISTLTKKYNIIAIDTQFPSTQQYNEKVQFNSLTTQDKYLRLCKNVDSTSLIQLGICLADQDGNVPLQKFCWQFNFKYQQNIDQVSSSSAILLKKAGINFQKLRSHGISYKTFTHQFIKSGLLLNKKNKWVVFHGGFDFSYLLKLIRNESLPKSIQQFYKSTKIYFPQKIDLKYLIQKDKYFKRFGLSKLADAILCRRTGPEHQAGSDSLLTIGCYFKLKQQYNHLFKNCSNTDNAIYGVGDMNEMLKHQKMNAQINEYYQKNKESYHEYNYHSVDVNHYIMNQNYGNYSENFSFNQNYMYYYSSTDHQNVNYYSSAVPYQYLYSNNSNDDYYGTSNNSSPYRIRYKPKEQ